MSRKSTGKRRRFEVFKRDNFTCQYCGAQPPEVLLVIDHVTAVAAGGTDAEENLITACEACNQGKAARPLTTRIVRPDADLLYLETQQEIAELKRFQESVRERDAEFDKVVHMIQEAWHQTCTLDWHPADHFIRQMLAKYNASIVYQALLDLAPKVETGYVKENTWDRYVWAVARNLAAEQTGEVEDTEPESAQIFRISGENEVSSDT